MIGINNLQIESEGSNLNVLDFGGNAAVDFLLLHGLAGRGREWKSTAEWLTKYGHVIALDQRGHGQSQSIIPDFSREAYVQDTIKVIEQYCDAPIVLIGQSMGGLNAFLVAAKYPDLVKALIVIEATPEPDPKAQDNIRNWLESWPVPFRNFDDAKRFFGGDTLYGRTFAESMEKRPDGYWPAFNNEDMIHSIKDVVSQNYWEDWRKISCPTLVVGGEKSFISQDLLRIMAKNITDGRYICISEAGHDLHLEVSSTFREVVESFLEEIFIDK